MAEKSSSEQGNAETETPNTEGQPSLGFFQMVGSILSSFFGVQSSKNSKRDFKHGKASQFIFVGIVMTLLWYGLISLIVNVVMTNR